MIAIDLAPLAWALNRYAPEHPRALRVVETLAHGDAPWAIPATVAHELLRLVTHPHAVARALSAADAWGFVRALLRAPSARLLTATSRHAEAVEDVLALLEPGTALPAGFETAVLLREHGVRELLSADRAMRAFPFLDVRDPIRGEPWTPAEPPARRYRRLAPRRRT